MPLQHFSIHKIPQTPWKNGGGLSREIMTWPVGASDFEWRASVATIAATGPFSVFPGVERTIVVLDGGGVVLKSDDGGIDHRLEQPLRPFRFNGEKALTATLIGGESTDFNIMTKRSMWRAQVEFTSVISALPPMDRGLVFCARGAFSLDAAGPLAEGEGVWWEGERMSMRAAPAKPASTLLIVRLKPSVEEKKT
jgi:environmental stress-induced protein Ves